MKKLSKTALIKEFNEFLRENNCASKFYVNRTKKRPKEIASSSFKRWPAASFLYRAFGWGLSPEGHYYWSEIQKKWNERLKAIKYNFEKSKSK